MPVETLHDTFVYNLQEMYYVETRLVDVLDEFAGEVSNQDLRDGLERHQEQTKEHVARLEEVFELIDEPPTEQPSSTFDGLLEDRDAFLSQAITDDDMRDLHNLGAAAKTEHLEIAGYENLIMLARKLDLPRDVRKRLDDNLDDEEHTKKQLKAMADDSTVRKVFARLAG